VPFYTRDDFMTKPDPAQQFDLFSEGLAVEEVVSNRARRLRIEVHSPDRVRLVIPHRVSRREALAFLQSRADWVAEKRAELKRAEARAPIDNTPMRWDGRDRLPLRGIERQVRLEPAWVRPAQVRVDDNAITVFAPSALLAQPASMRNLLVRTFKREAERDATAMLDTEAARLGVRYTGLRLADQRSLWGSCTPQGGINLSWRLVMAPPDVLRYVVVHELCHRVHADHSDAFWQLVSQQMPDYTQPYIWLRDHGARLHQLLTG
jgi:predicted metal-dependent hydrolase